MTVPLFEAVPNFSEGRDASVIEAIVDAMRAAGADVLDRHADADHHRSVVTAVGDEGAIEAAALAGARVAVERIDLRRHRGAHPRIGAVDVLPIVPLLGSTLADARVLARRIGRNIAEALDVPIFYYGNASDPPGRKLADLRKGGFEALVAGWPAGREPDVVPRGWAHPGAHPAAGAICVGARRLLLAWNVVIRDIDLAAARRIARELRERDGGLPGVRALALELPRRGVLQISMNLEDPDRHSPMVVFRELERRVVDAGGSVVETEVVGLAPDALFASAAEDRLRLEPGTAERLLSRRLLGHLSGESGRRTSVSGGE